MENGTTKYSIIIHLNNGRTIKRVYTETDKEKFNLIVEKYSKYKKYNNFSDNPTLLVIDKFNKTFYIPFSSIIMVETIIEEVKE